VQYAIVGHSERRNKFGETDKDIRAKVAAAIRNEIRPILCVGENSDERNYGEMGMVVSDQLIGGLANVSSEEIENVVIAYEPVWAIGTGKTASPEQAQEVHAFIRNLLTSMYDAETAAEITIQYGGSMNAANAAELMAKADIDGGLV
jgi:triosephosphate isomerase